MMWTQVTRAVFAAVALLVAVAGPAAAGGSGTAGDPFTTLNAAHTAPSSGRYYFDLGSGVFQADVDASEGGGWVLVLQYVHQGGTNPALSVLGAGADLPVTSAAALGTDESGIPSQWGHAGNAAMSQFTGDIELRWYGETSGHSRVLHFKSTLGDDYVRTGLGSFTGLASDFTALSGHTANLPGTALYYSPDSGDDALIDFPYYRLGTAYWGVRANGVRWELDDYPNDATRDTIHRVWVRAHDPLVVTSTADTNTYGTLRYAINHANANTADDAITFNIAGAGPHTISPTSPLPTITDDGVSIDGITQPGASCGQLTTGVPHDLRIHLEGTSAGSVTQALIIDANNVTIRGLSITNFGGHGISNEAARTQSNLQYDCVYVGVAPDGVTKGANSKAITNRLGVIFWNVSGGALLNSLLSGNDDDPDDDGVRVLDATNITIEGNIIGLDETAATAIGNGNAGIKINGASSNVTIGGDTAATQNIISANPTAGILVESPAQNIAVLGNRIFDNGGLAIDLGSDGVTLNDAGDGDAGPNDLLNFPVLNSVGADGTTSLQYDFDLDVPASANGYRVDFFKNTAADPTGHGEGEIHLGSVDVAHAGGNLNFTGSFTANAAVSAGELISAIATRKTGAATYDVTSEFSTTVSATTPPDPMVVTSTADTNTVGTLRYAINHANANTADDAITFNIAGAGPHTITLTSSLPTLTDDGVSIDGTTQPGAACGDLWGGTPHTLQIRLDGGAAGLTGVTVNGANQLVKGLSITGMTKGVDVGASASSAVLQCNYLGLQPDGTADGNQDGVYMSGSSNTLVGGLTAGEGNVLSGNGREGLLDENGAAGLMLRGNFIGTDPTGLLDRGNGRNGAAHINGPASWSDATRNLISGNSSIGLSIYFGFTGPFSIRGNYVGVDRTGLAALQNGGHGINIEFASSADVTIGGTTAADRNVVGANGWEGINIADAASASLLGNYIGVGADGATALGNSASGVTVAYTTGTIIGSAAPGGGNVISGGVGSGIVLDNGAGATIQGNMIGVAADGVTPVPNGINGVTVQDSGAQAVIGGDTAAEQNVIANNTLDGVHVSAGSAAVHGNSIHSNGGLGIDLGTDGVTANDAGDADTGPNALLNFPVLIEIRADGTTSLEYDFELDVPANANGYRVDFFWNSAADPSGSGEGETHLGSIDIAHGGGSQFFTGTFTANASVLDGDLISAIATRKTGPASYDITSEFSATLAASNADPALLAATKSISVIEDGLVYSDDTVAIPGSTLRYAITVRNDGAGAADDGTTVVIDEIPPNGAFKVSDYGGAAGAGPVEFTDGFPSSALTYSYVGLGSGADDIDFSSDGGVTWSYTPTDPGDGLDPNVTHIRIRPSGAFAENFGTPPSFTLRYEVVLH